jgi:hypothetical protein
MCFDDFLCFGGHPKLKEQYINRQILGSLQLKRPLTDIQNKYHAHMFFLRENTVREAPTTDLY